MTASQLTEYLVEEYAKIPEDQRVDTSDLARLVLVRIDPSSISPTLVGFAAYLELKQLARAVCRRRFLEGIEGMENGSLFDFKLQSRYPQSHEGKDADVYLPLVLMTAEDFAFNIGRLRKEASSKLRHAEALQTEYQARVRDGILKEKAA